MLRSLASAFLMYSKIPVPQVEWSEENRRYALCFFPLVGAVIGGILLIWRLFCINLAIGEFLYGAVSMIIPIAVTGGIHLDGYCDVSDARASCGDREKRLEIMKDSHIGAFAAIRLAAYLILQTALFSQISEWGAAAIVSLGFVLSRTLSGLSAVCFKGAKKDGSLQSFVKPAHRSITIAVLSITAAAVCAGMAILSPLSGAVCTIAAVLTWVYFRYVSYKEFGGVTGDLCGWFLQLCELSVLAAAVLTSRVTEVLL